MGASSAFGSLTKTLCLQVETRAANLCGVHVLSSSPALVWAHGLGGCCESDEKRGIGSILNPSKLGRTVLRLDLRGHGRSKAAHDEETAWQQYTWSELAKDLRRAAADSVSRSFFGGEGLGAAVALEAAIAAQSSGSIDAPPGLVLMRPPEMGEMREELREELRRVADLVEGDGFGALECMEEAQTLFWNPASAAFSGVSKQELQQVRRGMDKAGASESVHVAASACRKKPEVLNNLWEIFAAVECHVGVANRS